MGITNRPRVVGRTEIPLSMDYAEFRQCELGEICWVTTASRPDTCALLARIKSRINALCGSDLHRIFEVVRVAKDSQQATALKYASASRLWKALGRSDRAGRALRKRGERVHCGSSTLVGWSDASFGGQPAERKFRLGFAIGLMSSTLKGPCHISRRAPRFAQKMVKSIQGGEVCALTEMADHTLLLTGFFGPLEGMSPGVAGLEDCEGSEGPP